MDTARSDVALPARQAKNSGKVTLLALSDLDGRTHAAKRAKQLVAALGGDDPNATIEQRLRIQDLAVLNAMSEDIATRYFLGEHVDKVEFGTIANCKRRLLDSLS